MIFKIHKHCYPYNCLTYKFLCENLTPPHFVPTLRLGIMIWVKFNLYFLMLLPHKLQLIRPNGFYENFGPPYPKGSCLEPELTLLKGASTEVTGLMASWFWEEDFKRLFFFYIHVFTCKIWSQIMIPTHFPVIMFLTNINLHCLRMIWHKFRLRWPISFSPYIPM